MEIPSCSSIVTSSFFVLAGFGCEASSINFADKRAVRSVSTGPKTRLFNLELLAFMLLALDPFAMSKEVLLFFVKRSSVEVKLCSQFNAYRRKYFAHISITKEKPKSGGFESLHFSTTLPQITTIHVNSSLP